MAARAHIILEDPCEHLVRRALKAIEEYGADAEVVAMGIAETHLDCGELSLAMVWKGIGRAIRDIKICPRLANMAKSEKNPSCTNCCLDVKGDGVTICLSGIRDEGNQKTNGGR